MRAALLAVALLFAGPADMSASTHRAFWEGHVCEGGHGSKQGYERATELLRNHRPLTDVRQRRVRMSWQCVMTRAKAHAVHRRVLKLRGWRMRYAHRWPIRLNALPGGWVQWAKNITACESRWNRYASNGSHFSYFQFSAPTWASASAGFDPPASIYDASWPHQAVIAVHWAWRAGTSQWVCVG